MKRKQIIAIILVGVGMLSAGAAETLATPLLVEQGGFFNSDGISTIENRGAFSGDNFAVSIFDFGTGVGFQEVFTTGIYDVAFERGPFFGGFGGTIQVGDVSCQTFGGVLGGPDCSGTLRFISQPLTLVPDIFHEAPFTMTGQLVLGQVGLPNLIFDIEGSGIVTGAVHDETFLLPPLPPIPVTTYIANYRFAVPEPSSALLLFTGVSALLVARRRRASAGLRDRV